MIILLIKILLSLLLVGSGYGLGYTDAEYKQYLKEYNRSDVDDHWK